MSQGSIPFKKKGIKIRKILIIIRISTTLIFQNQRDLISCCLLWLECKMWDNQFFKKKIVFYKAVRKLNKYKEIMI